MIRTSLDSAIIATIAAQLSLTDKPVAGTGRQPVHTCYVPADKLTADLPREWGEHALALLDSHGDALDLPEEILAKVRAKLAREPVEDLRIDFEDGYGTRSDGVEDADAHHAATIATEWLLTKTAPPWFGIRFKSFDTVALLERGIRTLDVFLTTLVDQAGAPSGLALTFPKVTSTKQVAALCDLLEPLEARLGLPAGSLRFEIQIETTRAVVDGAGRLAVPRLIEAGRGRVSGLHFGTYDYTAECGLDAAQQHLDHPACDFARHVMQVGAAGSGVRLSDGSSNLLPVGDDVVTAWQTHRRLVRRSLEHGFHQSWDLHPGQLVTRYAAVHAYHVETAPESARRFSAYLARSTGSVADEPATARALAGSLRRSVDCGAFTEAEITTLAGTAEWKSHV
jgi:citrate lyase beta subunit